MLKAVLRNSVLDVAHFWVNPFGAGLFWNPSEAFGQDVAF